MSTASTFKSGRLLCAIALTVLAGVLLAGCKQHDKTATPAVGEASSSGSPLPAPSPFNVGICVNGNCGVLDQNGKVLVPFDEDVGKTLSNFIMRGTVALMEKNDQWQLVDLKTHALIKAAGKDIYDIGNLDYFGFTQDGKAGLMDLHGNVVQAPRFDSLYAGGKVVNGLASYIGFDVGKKHGILDIHGKQLTDAVYDDIEQRDFNLDHRIRFSIELTDVNVHDKGELLLAKKGDQYWLINLNNGTQQQVSYKALSVMNEGYMVVQGVNDNYGLVDAQGKLVVPTNYAWLGTPSDGLVAFRREKDDDPCGYMDYQGKVVIETKFGDCKSFGKKGALAALPGGSDTLSYSHGKYGLIDRTGAWLVQPTYDSVSEAGRSAFEGNVDYVRGYNLVSRSADQYGYKYVRGIFDLDQGRELIAPAYAILGEVAPQRFQFAKEEVSAGRAQAPLVGLMDAAGKALIPPGQYVDFTLDPSGRYLSARTMDNAHALFDLDGHMLIAPLKDTDEDSNAIFGFKMYENIGVIFGFMAKPDENYVPVLSLRAAYDLHGKPIFIIKNTDCGAEQLVDGNGKAIWPQDVKPYCSKEGKSDS